jgi:hypothetical protein
VANQQAGDLREVTRTLVMEDVIVAAVERRKTDSGHPYKRLKTEALQGLKMLATLRVWVFPFRHRLEETLSWQGGPPGEHLG